MARLEAESTDELFDALEDTTKKKPTQRLMVAILDKQGPSVPMIASWFRMGEATVYRWFNRLEAEQVRDAVRDDPRPGRPSKLDSSPEAEFGVEYTRRLVLRLLKRVESSSRDEG
jgi:transposase